MQLGAAAASAGFTVPQLKAVAEARRLRVLAAAMRAESAAIAAWVASGASPAEAPEPDPVLDAWQAAHEEAALAQD